MRDLLTLLLHLFVTVVRLCQPGGVRAVVAESLLLKHQLLLVNRSRSRAPNLRSGDRLLAGLCAALMRPGRALRSAIVLRPSTILGFHRALVDRKYRLLFSPKRREKPGPKGPSPELIRVIVEMKRRNPRWGTPRIAQQIELAFGIRIDKDVVRRVLAQRSRPDPTDGGPSWLSCLGSMKDSLWSADLFRCESLTLRSHWVLLVMDQYTRRIIDFAVQLDDVVVCRMFNALISSELPPLYLSTDHDPLFRFHRWRANLRIREVQEIKTVPYVPLSHPFVERLIGTVRREYLDQVPFWNAVDPRRKLASFQDFYNSYRTHRSLGGETSALKARSPHSGVVRLAAYEWESHCRGLFQTPVAA